MSKGLRLLLLASLGLNVALAAAFATHLWREARAELTASEAESLEPSSPPASLAERRKAVRETHAELRRAQARVAAALRRDPFDREALLAAFAELERARSEHARRSHELLIELAASLDHDGRERLAKRLRSERPHPPPGKGRRGPPR